jgi:hypothetical protein
MSTTSLPRRSPLRKLVAAGPSRQAFLLRRSVFTVAPIVFGLDKIANVLADWPRVYRGDLDGRQFTASWFTRGRVFAGMDVNVRGVARQIQDLIRSGYAIDPARLADPEVPLSDLVPAAPAHKDRP